MIHLYWGEGKGKTTAAMGLALRALGHGRRVSVVQFLKDGTSGEIAPLRELGAAVYTCAEAKFTWQMDKEERSLARERFTELLSAALREPVDLLVLDEACAACEAGLLDAEVLRAAVLRAAAGRGSPDRACTDGLDAEKRRLHYRNARLPPPL